ncbi:mitosis inhibitor protein kinase swe1 [Tilletia horrida]|uniref:Mitosis inhibitor protein kinase swe1 n=1 Tax=Tilletia horrida TaxID=155126 RepID=A0AAN6JJ34_9BASI|nr:mitosis inhibitor protein kinase swe1 [Tilletia horrida]
MDVFDNPFESDPLGHPQHHQHQSHRSAAAMKPTSAAAAAAAAPKAASAPFGMSSSASSYSASGSSMCSMSSCISNSSSRASNSASGSNSGSGTGSTSTSTSSRLRSESESSTRSRSDSFAGRHGRFSSNSTSASTSTSTHHHHHHRTLDLAPSSSISSAIGISSGASSTESHPMVFSTTPSTLFSASSSLSSMSTPQNYKNVKPLQDAFSSTGLASKKLRAVGKRPRASAPGSLPLTTITTPMKPMPDTPVKSKASRSQSFISLRHPPVSNLHYTPGGQLGSVGNDGSGFGSAFSRRHARISTENSSHMRRAVSAGVVSTPPRSYETMFNEGADGVASTSAAGPMTAPRGMASGAEALLGGAELTGAGADDVGRFARQFTVLSVLGSGEFSEAVEVEERSTRLRYAVKRTKRPATGSKARLRRLEEVDILRELSRSRHPASNSIQAHPNIVSLIDAWEEEGHLFMQLELCPLGNLADFLEEHGVTEGPLDEPRLWKVLAELAHGLHHIHSNGILHLDLKPANVFITAFGSLKIGDFGLASRWPRSGAAEIVDGAGLVLGPDDDLDRVALELAEEIGSPNLDDLDLPRFGSIGEEREKRPVPPTRPATRLPRAFRRLTLEREGDREYLAPEIMSRGQYGKPADMFSLGILMLEAAANVDIPDNGEAYQKLRNDDFSDVDLHHLSDQLVELLTGARGLLRSDPALRPTAEDIERNDLVLQVKQWMDKGLTKAEERRFVIAAASRNAEHSQIPRVLREPNRILPTANAPDPFLADPHGEATVTAVDLNDPPRTANRATFFSDAAALTTPVNGFKVLFPAPPQTGAFTSSNLSPISDLPSSQEAESPLPSESGAASASATASASSSMQWRGAIVEEDLDAFMRAILGPSSLGDRALASMDADDIEMSF